MRTPVSNRRDAFEIERKWLETFASDVKEVTGTYLRGKFKWENFSGGGRASMVALAGTNIIEAQDAEDFYLFNEDVSECWEHRGESYPKSPPTGGDWYVLPKSLAWTYIFTHDGQEMFISNEM